MKRLSIFFSLILFSLTGFPQITISKPIVNQLGYNLNEAKRFVCYGVNEGSEFGVYYAKDSLNNNSKPLFLGSINNFSGDFSSFNPIESLSEFIIKVEGAGFSFPFLIADHLFELSSSLLAYQFFIDVRGSENPVYSDESNVPGGGPSRDGGGYTLETPFEVLLYASNPALFDNWTNDFNDPGTPDLIKLILWHAEFAYQHRDYNGPTGSSPYTIGHPGEAPQTFDYQNMLDHLAPVCAAYHSFLKPYLSEEKYRRYRQVCKRYWEEYERHIQVRYYVNSEKWVDQGWQEFSEMGNVLGQSVLRNLFMYLCEKNEKDGDPEKYLAYAQQVTRDVIDNWDFNNPRHMWWIRNGEHITPQSLAFFLMVAPDEAPYGTRKKLEEWGTHIKERTDNFWHYRKHNEAEWAHSRTKELGNTGLGGSLFAASFILQDPYLRSLAWSQVNQVFGLNPAEAHYSNKSKERLEIQGYWEGIERGWPDAHPNGLGKLGKVRGTLDGTPLDNMFPYNPAACTEGTLSAYATEGWAATNRAWMTTVTFSTIGSHDLKIFDTRSGNEINEIKAGDSFIIQLRAALNVNPEKVDKGWVVVIINNSQEEKIEVKETGKDTGVFQTKYIASSSIENGTISVSYGYLGMAKKAIINVSN